MIFFSHERHHLLRTLRQNVFPFIHWYLLILLLLLYCLHLAKICIFLYRSQPVFVRWSFQCREMRQYLLRHSSLRSDKYGTMGHDNHTNQIHRAGSTHDQRGQKTEEISLLPPQEALKVFSSCLLDSSCTFLIPRRLTEILLSIERKNETPERLTLPDFKVVLTRLIGAVLAGEKIPFISYL